MYSQLHSFAPRITLSITELRVDCSSVIESVLTESSENEDFVLSESKCSAFSGTGDSSNWCLLIEDNLNHSSCS